MHFFETVNDFQIHKILKIGSNIEIHEFSKYASILKIGGQLSHSCTFFAICEKN